MSVDDLHDLRDEITRIWTQRADDKKAAKDDADRRHREVTGLIREVRDEVRITNGRVRANEHGLAELKAVDEERKRLAPGSAAVIPQPVVDAVKIGGGATGGVLLLKILEFFLRGG